MWIRGQAVCAMKRGMHRVCYVYHVIPPPCEAVHANVTPVAVTQKGTTSPERGRSGHASIMVPGSS